MDYGAGRRSLFARPSDREHDEEIPGPDSLEPSNVNMALSGFQLLQLPLEIRLQIYEHMLNSERYIDGHILQDYTDNKLGLLPRICRASKQIRAEAFAVYLRSSTVNFSSYPRPNIANINKYISTYNLRIDFWHHILRAHMVLRFPSRSTQVVTIGRVYQLLEAALSLKYLELTFSGWPHIPSGSGLLNAMGGNETLVLLGSRPKLEEVKLIWTLNAPGWGPHKANTDELRQDRWRWEEAARVVQATFEQNGVNAKVKPWMESADRRLWEEILDSKS